MYRQVDGSRKYGTPQRERTIKKGELKREKGELREGRIERGEGKKRENFQP
jgi:hypothetical protein